MAPRRILAIAVLAGGCYSTTPHQARVVSPAQRGPCAAAVGAVFDGAGFIQLPTPPRVSMFFGPRMSGPYTSSLQSGVGVGVTIHENPDAVERCDVTLQALSADVGCPDTSIPFSCASANHPSASIRTGGYGAATLPPCPVVGTTTCALSYAPGAENDAAVDELARRLRAELGPSSRVN